MTTNTALWGADTLQSDRFGAGFSGLFARLRRNWARRRTHILLSDLDDFTLDDIGLDPSHVRRTRPGAVDWVVQSHSGTARLVFIGR
jgi:uncharacterized protein YjiS (DUF1127 family)